MKLELIDHAEFEICSVGDRVLEADHPSVKGVASKPDTHDLLELFYSGRASCFVVVLVEARGDGPVPAEREAAECGAYCAGQDEAADAKLVHRSSGRTESVRHQRIVDRVGV
jgi:hypothetical protein